MWAQLFLPILCSAGLGALWSCSSAQDQRETSPTTTATTTSTSPTTEGSFDVKKFNGSWSFSCLKSDDYGYHSSDITIQDGQFAFLLVDYEDATCQIKLGTEERVATGSMGSQTAERTYKAEYKYTKFALGFATQEAIDQRNQAGTCGKTDWKIDEPVDWVEHTCMTEELSGQIYDLYQLSEDGNTLLRGHRVTADSTWMPTIETHLIYKKK